ncbi:MAG TPA: ABC transporter permease [Chryseolinea sp.]|nr:ABC transporter permease [Chryseolinea sp.]
MPESEIKPPRWAEKVLNWYCRPELLEDLQGDLYEYFQRRVRAKGIKRARLIYIIDVIKFMRPYTLRKPTSFNALIHWIMFTSYIKTSGRSIVRNKLFSTINIVGLGVSMSVGLLMIAMLSDLYSYDKFHDKHSRIYRLISKYEPKGNNDSELYASSSLRAAKAIKESFSGAEDVAILRREFSGDMEADNKFIPLRGLWANASFFNVFSFDLLLGNPASALQEPYRIVLTETAAKKLFGHIDVLGKVVRKGTETYTVTGVLKDVPKFSHFRFDMLASLSTFESQQQENAEAMKWTSMWDTWTYVLMKEASDIKAFQPAFDKLSAQENKNSKVFSVSLQLQRIDDIMTGENLSNQIGPIVGQTPVRVFLALSFVVVLSACFNYTNLSLARAFRRNKEVGIRKTIGAMKRQVISQFIVESVAIALLALASSFLIFLFIRPHFIGMEESLQELLVLQLSPRLIIAFVAFATVIGVLAGLAPAMSFARVSAIHAFKNFCAAPAIKGITLRKALIVFQYCISIIGITATLVIYRQYKHYLHYDLGFSTANVLNIYLQENDGARLKAERLKKELQELHEVKEISHSALISSLGGYWVTNMKYSNNPGDSAGVYYNLIDENYLPLHDYTLMAGRNFNYQVSDSLETEVIVNQATLKRFNIAGGDADKSIGEVVTINRKNMTIVGVLNDFVYGKPNDNVNKEVVMRYSKQPQYLNVKIESTDWPATYARIESIWKRIDPVHPLGATFYSEQIADSYKGIKASVKVGGFLSALVICIASIGLLGMVIFTTEIRMKEVSIRKVHGASETGLLVLLSRNFLLLLLIAAGIALPATYLFFDMVLLPTMENSEPLRFIDMISGALAVLLIALIMIVFQTRKVARTNPADILKSE